MQNKHKCKLCSKSFCNGRALGGHMKSHLVSSQPSTRKKLVYSSSSSSSSDVNKSLVYGLRENPRKSSRIFSNPDPESSTVYNSETETSKKKMKRVSENSKKQKIMSHDESPEPASCISDGSTEQDLAMCLMMLSRDSREVKIKPEEVVEETKPEKLHFLPELRRCLIDLNLPPPQDAETVTVVSAL